MLDLLIPSEARRKLLTRFLMHPQEEYYGAQLHRTLDMHPNSVHRELGRLERAGLVLSRRSGGQVYYRANQASAIYPELRLLVLKTAGLGEALADGLSKVDGVDWAFIYGSVARGDEGPGSDVDVMIVGEASAEDVEDVVNHLERQISRPVNHSVLRRSELVRRYQDGRSFTRGVIDGPKIMLLGDEDELRRAAGG